MPQRIYLVRQGDIERLIRASNPAVARSFIARDSIDVSVASPEDTFRLAQQGAEVEETQPGALEDLLDVPDNLETPDSPEGEQE